MSLICLPPSPANNFLSGDESKMEMDNDLGEIVYNCLSVVKTDDWL